MKLYFSLLSLICMLFAFPALAVDINKVSLDVYQQTRFFPDKTPNYKVGQGDDIPVRDIASFDYGGRKVFIQEVKNGLSFINTSTGVGMNLRGFNAIVRGHHILPNGNLVIYLNTLAGNCSEREANREGYIDPLAEGTTEIVVVAPHNISVTTTGTCGSQPYAIENNDLVLFDQMGFPWLRFNSDTTKLTDIANGHPVLEQVNGGMVQANYFRDKREPLVMPLFLEKDAAIIPKYDGTIYNMFPSFYNPNLSFFDNYVAQKKYTRPITYAKKMQAGGYSEHGNSKGIMPEKMQLPIPIVDYTGSPVYGDAKHLKVDME